jgi:hypothetical protein
MIHRRVHFPLRDAVNNVMGIVLVCLLVLSFYFALVLPPKIYGDGLEYTVQLWALASHLSPEIRPSDIESLSSYIQGHDIIGFRESFLSDLVEQVRSKGLGDGLFFESRSGQYFGLHFWFYSAVCAPIKWTLQLLQGNELKAFQLTNAVLLALSLAYLFSASSLSMESRFAIALLFYGVGTSDYLRWPGTETFSAAACLVASVAFLEGRLLFSTFAFGICALQNTLVALMIPVIFVSQLDHWLKLPVSEKVRLVGRFTLAGSCSLLPIAWFFVLFGTPSLIAKEGYLQPGNMTFSRLYSFFFDLNQGMVVGAGWIVGLAGLVLLARFFSSSKALGWCGMNQMFHRDDWLLVGMLLMTIGVLPQRNWNAGQSVYLRYALWLSIPLMVWTVYQGERGELKRWWLRGVVVAQLLTIFMFGVFAGADAGAGYLQHKWVPNAVLSHAPWAYNPDPEIFAERTLGREVYLDEWRKPILYRIVRNGTITKILVHESQLDTLSEEACGKHSELLTLEGGPIRPDMLQRTRSNFVYISGSFHCSPAQ